ncbi:MAG: hypothetical protein JRH11_26150 [Deltaproteobacteria bacterium]|nr:hypothetical protein [Deltaproteobacteria bacterium]
MVIIASKRAPRGDFVDAALFIEEVHEGEPRLDEGWGDLWGEQRLGGQPAQERSGVEGAEGALVATDAQVALSEG